MSKKDYQCTACGKDLDQQGCCNTDCPIGFHNVATMSPDILEAKGLSVKGNGDALEKTRQQNYKLGKVSVLEQLGPDLRKMSGEQFAKGHDTKAKFYRTLAEHFECEAEIARTLYEAAKQHPADVQ